jgi:hypothetical protein
VFSILSSRSVRTYFLDIGRKLFFAIKDEIARERRRKQLETSCYVFGAYTSIDSVRNKDKRILKLGEDTVMLLNFG